jgi:hypothetical protein
VSRKSGQRAGGRRSEVNEMTTGNGKSEGESGRFEIRVKGRLSARWADRFDGFTLTPFDDGTTVLAGYVDQAALQGVLRSLADLGLPLVSVTPSPGSTTPPTEDS